MRVPKPLLQGKQGKQRILFDYSGPNVIEKDLQRQYAIELWEEEDPETKMPRQLYRNADVNCAASRSDDVLEYEGMALNIAERNSFIDVAFHHTQSYCMS